MAGNGSFRPLNQSKQFRHFYSWYKIREKMKRFIAGCLGLMSISCFSQTFYFGNDLSYANQMEDCGAVFKENGIPKDVYRIFADHGTNLVRVRLWNEPSWQNSLSQPAGVKSEYSDFEDVKETVRRAKNAGMMVMLDLQLSDFWADPGKQLIPAPWIDVATDTALLADSVYNYVTKILSSLGSDTIMPEIVKIGNENNGGILRHTILNPDYSVGGSVSNSWARHAHLYKAAIKAVRDIGISHGIRPKICLHYSGIQYVASWYQTLMNHGVTDFDIIGFSYYYAWHGGSIAELGNTIRSLKSAYPDYEVMVAETGYIWSLENFDGMANIIATPDPAYLPVCLEKQLEYMVDYTREVMNAGGSGVIFWEPDWVSTPCRTPWGQGSAHDHLVFFDPENTNFMENGGGRWTEPQFYEHNSYKKVTFKVSSQNAATPGKMYITGNITGESWKIMPMFYEGQDLYNWSTYLPEGDSGAFYFLSDSLWEARETVPAGCAIWWNTDRGYKIGSNDTIISYKWGTCQSAETPADVKVTFRVDMTGQDVSSGVWMTGSMTGSPWNILNMYMEGDNIYGLNFTMHPGDSGAYYFMNDNVWGSRETVPRSCADWWNTDRGYKIGVSDTSYEFTWGTCLPLGSVSNGNYLNKQEPDILIYPNPAGSAIITIESSEMEDLLEVRITDLSGQLLLLKKVESNRDISLDTNLPAGTYILSVKTNGTWYCHKLIIR
jgi:arabinogalactan endo-1,4-beta-galactosidase